MAVELSDREYHLFREWISEEYGLCFGPERREILRSRLETRRAELGLDDFEQLYFLLKFHPDRARERERLIPYLTNNESYFFREPAQLELLVAEVLPAARRRLEREGRRELRILSAACAAGEEAYSLAISIRESGLYRRPWSVTVTGVDLDPEALARARGARYTRNAFRRIEPRLKERYFSEVEEGIWELEGDTRAMVRFEQGNLIGPGWARSVEPQDVVFCRNVLIYFGDRAIERAAENLYRTTVPGGALFLGHAETLSRVPTRFVPQRRPGAIYYSHPEDGG